jgi:hypothetical protein
MDLIRKILREYDDEEEVSIFDKEMFPEKVYQKIFRIFDKHIESNPNFIFDFLEGLNLFDEDIRSEDLESNIIYKYLTEHKDRPNSHIKITFIPSEMSTFFCDDDGDYDIQSIARSYFRFEYDYGVHYDCYDFDVYYFDKIDKQNLDLLREYYLRDLEGEPSEEGFEEFVEEEFGSDIGCAAGDAQHSADIEVLHSDFEEGITDYLSNFNGELQNQTDKEGNKGDSVEYVGYIELGDLVSSPGFKEILHAELTHGYPNFTTIFDSIIIEEQDGGAEYNYFLPEDCISIDTYKHFRYGGAGDVDWGFFNEILLDRINNY